MPKNLYVWKENLFKFMGLSIDQSKSISIGFLLIPTKAYITNSIKLTLKLSSVV